MRLPKMRFAAVAAAGVLAMGTLAACGSDDGGGDSGDSGSGSGGGSLTVGVASGWAEGIAISHLWKYVLENEMDYEVELQTLDVAPIFEGVASGDLDLFFDTWLPVTHEDYWKDYKDQVEDLGVWYDQATLNIAVPDYVDMSSIADLKGEASTFNGTITGIDSGAGLTRVTREEAMPAYGLDDYNLKTSSTPAMLAALKSAIDEEKPIVVTLWHPHWAYSEFPVKDLKDPKGAMGEAEEIHTIGAPEFSDEHSEVAQKLKNFKIDDATLADLENVVLQKHEDDPEAGAEEWVKNNQDFVDKMLK